MKRNLKVVALLLSLVMILTACGGGKSGDAGKKDGDAKAPEAGSLKGEISVQAEKGWKEYYQKAIDKIVKENPDAKITIKEAGSFDHLDVIDSTNAENPDVADVFAIPADRIFNLYEKEVLGALDAKAVGDELGGWDNYDEQIGGVFKVEEEYFAVPYNIETLVTFVNTKNAEAAKIDATKPIELNDQKDPATVLLPLFDAWFGVAPNNAGKIDLLAEEGEGFKSTYAGKYEELEADQKAVFDGIYEYWKLNNDAGTSLFDADAGWGYIDEQFATGGKGVARIGGPWEAAGFQEKAGEGNMEVYPIGHITIAGKPLSQWQGGWGLSINSRIEEDADKVALATALIKELVNPENAAELYKSTGKILGNVKAEDYDATDLSDFDKKLIKLTLESYEASPQRPVFKEYGNVWDTWKNGVLSWNSVKPKDAASAYKELNAAFSSMMEQIGK